MRYAISLLALLAAAPLPAQVAVMPQVTTPAEWERFAVMVINQTDTATVSVRVEVPEVVRILGVEPKAGWTIAQTPATDSSGQAISWTGGSVTIGQFGEFAFLGRIDANAKKDVMSFPVRIQRANGSVVDWRRPPGQPYAAPLVQISGTVGVSTAGMVALAGAGIGIGILAIIIAVALGTRKK